MPPEDELFPTPFQDPSVIRVVCENKYELVKINIVMIRFSFFILALFI